MFVEVDLGQGSSPRLVEPENFKAFKLVADGAEDEDGLGRALGALGEVDAGEGHVWLRIDGVRSLAGELADDPDWDANFTGMVAFAEKSGWLSPSGDAIRAHVEWSG